MTLDRLSEASWRVRLCSSQPGLAYLSLSDHRSTVTSDGLEAAVASARALGATRVRTSALFDESVPALTEAGFVDLDRLVLLQRQLDQHRDQRADQLAIAHPDVDVTDPDGGSVRLHRFTRRSLRSAARVDAAAFGARWATDRSGLADVMAATQTSWGRYASAGWGRGMAGFVLCGASGADGYIQRLAVQPSLQRRGIASTLLDASLHWMSKRGSTSVLVNTRPDNRAALALYERWGFTRLRHELIVAERVLR